MNNMKASVAFRRAMKIIETPETYAAALHAEDASGRTCLAHERSAVRWSLLSAIEKATGHWNNRQTWDALIAVAANRGITQVGQLGDWSRSLSHAEALEALELAAQIEEHLEVTAA